MTEIPRRGAAGLDAEELAALVVALLCRPPVARDSGSAPKAGWSAPGKPSGFVVAHSWQTTTLP